MTSFHSYLKQINNDSNVISLARLFFISFQLPAARIFREV